MVLKYLNPFTKRGGTSKKKYSADGKFKRLTEVSKFFFKACRWIFLFHEIFART